MLEARTIGCCLNSINASNFVFAELLENDFYNPAHRLIFSEARNAYVANDSLDFHWIVNALAKKGKIEAAGGIEYLTKLSFYFGDGGDWEAYSRELRNLSQLRTLIHMANEIPNNCCKPEKKAEDIINEVQSHLFKLQRVDTTTQKRFCEITKNISEHGDFEETTNWMVQQALQNKKPYTGIASGYEILDETLGYFRPGAVYYIGARTSMGKTTFLLNLMSNMASSGVPVGMFSLEMPSVQIVLKLTCLKAGIKFSQYEEGRLSPTQLNHVVTTCKELDGLPLFFEEQPGLTIGQVKARAKRMQINHGIKILMVDYLTLIQSNAKYNNKHMQVDEVSKGLQNLAKELNIPILCLAQLNRQLTSRKDFTPTLSDFRESGSIEEDADACILLHRPDYYESTDKPGQIQIIVAKNRIRGILRKIAFTKDTNSERYIESKDLGQEVKRINLDFNPRDTYKSPYDEQ